MYFITWSSVSIANFEQVITKTEYVDIVINIKKNNFIAPFYGWGSTVLRLESLQGGSLLFTTKFPETGTHFNELRRMKG